MPPIQYSLILFYIIITKLSRECEIFFYQIAHISREMALSGKTKAIPQSDEKGAAARNPANN